METPSTLSMRQEYEERSLFLFVVVVGYLVTFALASQGEIQYSIQELLLGIASGVIYLTPVFFETDIVWRFSHGVRNAIYFPSSQTGLLAVVALPIARYSDRGIAYLAAIKAKELV